MFEEYESRGKTVDEAIFKGLNELGISIDEVEVKIVQTETRGVFGIGAKPAIVILKKRSQADEADGQQEVRSREAHKTPAQTEESLEPDMTDEAEDAPSEFPERESREEVRHAHPGYYEREHTRANAAPREPRGDQPYGNRQNSYQQGGYNRPYQQRYHEQEYRRSYDDESDSRSRMKIVDTPSGEYTEEAVEHCEAALFVQELLEQMDIPAKVTAVVEEERHFVNISSHDNAARVIGKRGETLAAIQYITALVVNRERANDHIKVTVDSDGYCQRHYEQLVRTARAKANIVRSTGRDYRFEPMSAYDRRIIHFALQRNPAVFTHSEGEEPNRFLIISPKNRRRRY